MRHVMKPARDNKPDYTRIRFPAGQLPTTMPHNPLVMFRMVRRVVAVRRTYSIPEQITMLSAGAAAVGAICPMITERTWGRWIQCPLRTLTGMPCPFCGLTTATVGLVQGQWATAAAANPLAYLPAAIAIGTAPLMVARTFGKAALPRQASQRTRRRIAMGAIAVATLSWLYQLHRYEFI